MTEPMNFAPKPSAAFSAAFEGLLDATIKGENEARDADYRARTPEAMRPAIGAGRLGNECLRAIAYQYHRTPTDPGREFSGRLYRIFARGHRAESAMPGYLRAAGFTILTENAAGRQFRYDLCKYEDGKGRIKGMIDGVITAGPEFLSLGTDYFKLSYPMLWENKELGAKGFAKLKKLGLRGYGGDYFPQVQLGMFHLGLTDNPALFTVTSADTQEIYAELIPADAQAIQTAIDRGVRVIDTRDPEEMPRVAKNATDFRCKFCDFADRCWRELAIYDRAPGDTSPKWGLAADD